MTGFQRLIVVTCLVTYALVVLGAIVRVTGSGLGCPDWPLCHGQIVPPFEREVLIEYSHRLAAALVTPLVLATAFVTWRSYRHVPVIVVASTAAVVLLAVQVLLGGITVLLELPETVVTVHLATALALLAVLLLAGVAAFTTGPVRRERGGPDQFSKLVLVTTLATYGLMLTGAYVRGSGASLGCPDWPLCYGRFIPTGDYLAAIHFLHRLAAATVGVLIFTLAVHLSRERSLPNAVRFTTGLAVLIYGAQVLVGAANIWFRLSPGVVAAHVALASALWADLIIATALSYDLRRLRFGWLSGRTRTQGRLRAEAQGVEERGAS